MDATELRKVAARRGVTQTSLARAMGVVPKTLKNKLEGRSQFKEGEIRALAQALQLSRRQIDRIFFDWGVN